MTELNLDAWRELRDLIASLKDDQIAMGYFLGRREHGDFRSGKPFSKSLLHDCGTVGCIAGYALLLREKRMPEQPFDVAAEILGLDREKHGMMMESDAYYVFMGRWCEGTRLSEITRQDVLAYMDRVIETGNIRCNEE
jgi:hypothetical protein